MAEFTGRTTIASDHASIVTVDDLERYCYYVAGTVGQLLTELFRQHRPLPTTEQYQRMKSLGGKKRALEWFSRGDSSAFAKGTRVLLDRGLKWFDEGDSGAFLKRSGEEDNLDDSGR